MNTAKKAHELARSAVADRKAVEADIETVIVELERLLRVLAAAKAHEAECREEARLQGRCERYGEPAYSHRFEVRP